jgi:Na+/alanine symporter
MTALAATVGTGNIAGVAGDYRRRTGRAIWMWMTGLVGMATKFAEALLAVKYRVVDDRGEMAGGPMPLLERGLGVKWLGVVFARSRRSPPSASATWCSRTPLPTRCRIRSACRCQTPAW